MFRLAMTRSPWITAMTVVFAVGCTSDSAFERLSHARELSADLLVQFTKAADAANKAVMADTDDTSVAFAAEANQANQAVQKDADALRPILQSLGYAEETRLLEDFAGRFLAYRALDDTILELAVQNTNLKAQRLAFGPALEAADAFQDALEAVARSDSARDSWRVRALSAAAIASLRAVQVLQAPHIADADDLAMTRMEERMAASESAARKAVEELGPLAPPASRPQLAQATAALDRFIELNTQITALSRRNTNVRSLALSLNQKAALTSACDESLHGLRDALGRRGFTGTR